MASKGNVVTRKDLEKELNSCSNRAYTFFEIQNWNNKCYNIYKKMYETTVADLLYYEIA